MGMWLTRRCSPSERDEGCARSMTTQARLSWVGRSSRAEVTRAMLQAHASLDLPPATRYSVHRESVDFR